MKFRPLRCHFTASLFSAILATALLSVLSENATGFQLLSPPSSPLDEATSAAVRTLMTTQWERNPTHEVQSKQTFEGASIKNSTLLVAYATNRLKQNKTRESKMIAEELTNRYPDNLDGWMLKIWLNTLEDNFDIALISMRSFKKKIDTAKNLPDTTKILIYKRLGRLIGYMQGPVADRVNKDVLDGTILAVADGVAPHVLKSFNENRDQVLKKYDDLLRTQTNKTQIELAKVQAENEQERIALERENQLLEQAESQLIPEKERIRRAASQQVSSLEQQGSSIQQRLNAISSDVQAAQLNLQFMYADLAVLTRPRTRQYVSSYGLRNEILNVEFALSSLNNEWVGLSNQLNGIGIQIAQARNSARQQLDQIQKEINRVNGAKRRNLGKLARIARGPVLADGKRSSMKNRATSLVTYDELSEELYRQQILDHLPAN